MAYVSSPRETQEEMRERALDIGVALIREGGLSQVKARVLAVRLNVSVGTIYNLFGQMDEFVYRLNARALDGLFVAGQQAIDGAKAEKRDVTGQMLALSRAYLDYVMAHPDEWNAVLTFMQRRTGTPPDWYKDKERAVSGLVASTIAQMPGMDDIQRCRMMARAMWGAVHGIVTVSLRPAGMNQDVEEIWEQIDFVVRSIATSMLNPPQT